MKKITLLVIVVFTLMEAAPGQLPARNQVSGRQTDNLKASKATRIQQPKDAIQLKDSTIMDLKIYSGMKIQKQPAEQVLRALHPGYSGEQLWEIITSVKMMFDSSYGGHELIPAIISTYDPSIREVTFIVYHAYYETANGKTAATPWAHDFHSKITTAFHAEGITLEQLLKNTDGIVKGYTCDVREVFAFQYHYLKLSADTEAKNKFFANLISAGYDPAIIYSSLIIQGRAPWYNFEFDKDRRELWTPFYCAGMKKSAVYSGNVVKALLQPSTPKFTPEQVIQYLQQAGYTTNEILEGMRSYTR